jgi:hypothetical protein
MKEGNTDLEHPEYNLRDNEISAYAHIFQEPSVPNFTHEDSLAHSALAIAPINDGNYIDLVTQTESISVNNTSTEKKNEKKTHKYDIDPLKLKKKLVKDFLHFCK